MGFKFLINRGRNPGLSRRTALVVLLLSVGEYSPGYVVSEIIFSSALGAGAMESNRNRESGMTQVSIMAWGYMFALTEGSRSIVGFCASVFREETPRIKIIYTTMYFTLSVYANYITMQRYEKILIPCNT